MGPIAYLWHWTLGWRRRLPPGRPGVPEVCIALYLAFGVSVISLGLGSDTTTTALFLAHRVTPDSVRVADSPPLSVRTGRNADASARERLHRRLSAQQKSGPAHGGRDGELPPPPTPGARYERLGADPPPAEPLTITLLDVSVSSSTARVSWSTNFQATGQGAYAVGESPTLWTSLAPFALAHETTFAGLAGSTNYTVWVQAMDDWERTATSEAHVRTLPAESSPIASASASGGTIRVNDRPFFPLALWDVCPSAVSRRIDDGINLFMGDGCGNEQRLLGRLRGETFAVTDATNGLSGAPGLIGWYYPDELDGRLEAAPSNAELGELAVNPPAGLLTFLTLTNHFYSGAEPLPLGRAVYPGLAGLANVLGFDLYPLQNWCRFDRFDAVYRAQRELEALAAGKPTYQWIEARQMDCPGGALDPTPASVRAETWLAIAGGAEGIGYFPNNWRDDIGDEIRDLNAKITELAPALLGEKETVESTLDVVNVGARMLNGALYVIAVNTGGVPVEATIHAPGLGTRPLAVFNEGRQLAASDKDVFTDGFGPLAVHIYIAAPPDWNSAQTAR